MDIDINFLRHAVAVGENLHFGNAAKSLQLSQPALSRSISKLELRLGQPLFIRGTKSITTTDFGRLFIEKAKILLKSVNEFTTEMVEERQDSFTLLEIGAGPYPVETIVATASARFSMGHPKVELVIRVETIENMLSLLMTSGGLECLIAEVSMVSLLPELEVIPMGKHPLYFVARAGHPLAGTQPTLQQLLHYPLISPTRLPTRVLEPLLRAWKNIPIDKRSAMPAYECASMSAVKQILAVSDAFTAMPLSVAAENIERGKIIILSSEPLFHLNYGLVQRTGHVLSNTMQQFKKILFEEESKLARQEKRLHKLYFGK